MLCDADKCPNPARVTLYGKARHEQKKVDLCKPHMYFYKQLGYEEQVLDSWDMNYEKLPTENFFRKLVRKLKK